MKLASLLMTLMLAGAAHAQEAAPAPPVAPLPGSAADQILRGQYLATAADRELPPALQRRFSTNLAPSWRREIATGHLPMLESPDALAESIALFLDGRTEGSV